jgi:DtxR family Mn-dependent transcriptional regulator
LMASEITEQYLKIIYNLTEEGGLAKTNDIASKLGISPASVTEMLHKLSDQGYVRHEAYKGVVLKPKGFRIAKKMARRHRLLERFLVDFIGTTGVSTHKQACKMEHALTDETERNLCMMMHRPEQCPGGRKIPKCDRRTSCESCTQSDIPLDEVDEGQKVVVSHLVADDKSRICEMLSMGFVPGCEILVEKKLPMGGPIIVSLKGAKVALARDSGRILHVLRPV